MSTTRLRFKCLICFSVAMLVLLPASERASGEAAPEPLGVVLFYSSNRVVPERETELVVKVQNKTDQPISVLWDPLSTHVVDSQLEKLTPTAGWTLELVVDVEGDPGIMVLSGKIEAVRTEVSPSSHAILLFTPPSNRLPGKRFRVWAELRSFDGQVYRSDAANFGR